MLNSRGARRCADGADTESCIVRQWRPASVPSVICCSTCLTMGEILSASLVIRLLRPQCLSTSALFSSRRGGAVAENKRVLEDERG